MRHLDTCISVLVYICGEARVPQQKQVKMHLQEAINLNKYFVIANNVLESSSLCEKLVLFANANYLPLSYSNFGAHFRSKAITLPINL